jgi:hypothetical protein
MFQLEAEMVRVEGDRPGDVLHLIAHAVHLRVVHYTLLGSIRGSSSKGAIRCAVHFIEPAREEHGS